MKIFVRFWLPKAKQGGISEGEAAELNAPLLSGYLETR
jgi:hypothetical protein